jgi:hypothetical protein
MSCRKIWGHLHRTNTMCQTRIISRAQRIHEGTSRQYCTFPSSCAANQFQAAFAFPLPLLLRSQTIT